MFANGYVLDHIPIIQPFSLGPVLPCSFGSDSRILKVLVLLVMPRLDKNDPYFFVSHSDEAKLVTSSQLSSGTHRRCIIGEVKTVTSLSVHFCHFSHYSSRFL